MTLSPESLKEDILDIKRQLSEIQRTVNVISVQDERIKHMELSVEALWKRIDKHTDSLDQIVRYQASCPRESVKWVWWILVPQSLALIGLLIGILSTALHHGVRQ